jgi:hypothetical protein
MGEDYSVLNFILMWKKCRNFFNVDLLFLLYFVNVCWARQKLLMALKRLMKLFLQMQSCLLRIFLYAEDTVLILIKTSGRSVHLPIVNASCCPLDVCVTVCFVPNMKTLACRKWSFCYSVNTTLNVQIPGPCNIQVTPAEVCGVMFVYCLDSDCIYTTFRVYYIHFLFSVL